MHFIYGSALGWAVKFSCFTGILRLASASEVLNDPYNYRNITPVYVPPLPSTATTLYQFINSRPDLSSLAAVLEECGGLREAFDANPTWKFTFFAPNDDAFQHHTGAYFNANVATPKGKWWVGNSIIHHYVPDTILSRSAFNGTYQRFQTATYLYIGAQAIDQNITLNNVATIIESDIPVTQGVVHVIDRILDPSAQIFETDLSSMPQAFIAGSCSNPNLPYC